MAGKNEIAPQVARTHSSFRSGEPAYHPLVAPTLPHSSRWTRYTRYNACKH